MPGERSEPADLRFGPVTYLVGPSGGRYPDGNSLLVEGARETVLIDPSVGLIGRDDLPAVQRVVHSHCHEDHVAGSHLFPDVPWHFHSLDLPGIESIDAMMAIYGFAGPQDAAFRKVLVDEFHYVPRADATPFDDGAHFDLGGGVTLDAIHTPGHTRGHCCLLVSWPEAGETRRLLYLGDIELTRFGPYYGDAWSDLEDFEASLAKVRDIPADFYATFHHIGVLEGRAAFLERLDVFEAKIASREAELLAFLAEPRSLEELIAHRFVYRPGDPVPFADSVERRSITQHLARMQRHGQVEQDADGRYRAV